MARAIHAASPRAAHPIVSRNAATLPEGIVDAELFGNARNYPNVGAPERPGLIGAADGTTLFLDEFGELPRAVQVHLLRVLDQGEYQRLGESRLSQSDLRLIAATNRPPSVLKEDVLARLTFRIEVPDFHARKEDVPLLARHLLRRILSRDAELAVSRASCDAEGPPRCRWPSSATSWSTPIRRTRASSRPFCGEPWRRGATCSNRCATKERRARPSPRAGLAPDHLFCSARPGGPTVAGPQRCLDAHNGVIEDAWRDLGLSSRHALTRLIRKHGIEVRKRLRQ